ncbi:acyl-CoA dehydrogenase family protein [Bacteroidota bacterium]|nr:acyl-CoA dehydrogenase family protein [Bacteroidota bacterium]
MKTNLKGGGFLISETNPDEIFILEEFGEEAKMMLEATREFNEKEIKPNIFEFEKKNYKLTEDLMKKIGEMGLLGITVPEKYGGLGMGLNISMLICGEISSYSGSIATAYGAHTGIGTLPILFYGTNEVKEKFLPKICSGEWMSCYNLTEPNAGSDANSGKTTATLTNDGNSYEITGQKIWISNAGFAEVFILFGRIENDKNITGFVLEKSKSNGINLGEEENKLGLRASSTRQVFYEKTLVPKEQMLGERGDGFKIALNALNAGRIKLGAATGAAAIKVINECISYAIERKQFGESISNFGAIQEKLAIMASSVYTTMSGLYRAGFNIEENTKRLEKKGVEVCESKKDGIIEYSVECSIIKVHGSEVIRDVSDEAIQIFGGMGFSAESIVEPAYRDARISRIYEGTNEINRMLIVGMLIRKALKKEIDLFSHAKKAGKELISIFSFFKKENISGVLGKEKTILKNVKKLILILLGKCSQVYKKELENEQEIMINLANMIIDLYMSESCLLRSEKLTLKRGEDNCEIQILMSKNYILKTLETCSKSGFEIIQALPSSSIEKKILLKALNRLTKKPDYNIKEIRRKIASDLISNKKYRFNI